MFNPTKPEQFAFGATLDGFRFLEKEASEQTELI